MKANINEIKVAVIGLGYVGLPVAAAFGRQFNTIGFDIDQKRIRELQSGHDHTKELMPEELKTARKLSFSDDETSVKDANFYIVTVPTPIDESKSPDLRPLKAASGTVGAALCRGDVVVYESTVFPGCTEEVCVPLLEAKSGLKFNRDFFCGYSPERINPGDTRHRLSDIKKVVSGSTREVADYINSIYSTVIEAGTHLAPSIKVAEAAKVIENAQRDLNIAFVNELSLLFQRLGIDTLDVLRAAETKWNFLPFRPGLVGGHCIGVDPYYLTHKAAAVGHRPEIILAGRRVNDSMGKIVANRLVKLMIRKKQIVAGAKVLVVGITFKENCPDVRNTKVVDIIDELKTFDCTVDVFDPHADYDEVKSEYGIELLDTVEGIEKGAYDGCLLAVPHDDCKNRDWRKMVNSNGVLYDVKGALENGLADDRL